MTRLKEQAWKQFASYIRYSYEDAKKAYSASDIRDKITEDNSFNLECKRDFDVRGNSNAFWEAVIKWCTVTEVQKTATYEPLVNEALVDDVTEEVEEEKDTIYVNGWARYSFDYTKEEWQEQLRLDKERKSRMTSKDNEYAEIQALKAKLPDDAFGIAMQNLYPEQCHSVAIEKLDNTAIDWEWELNNGAMLSEYPPLQVSTFSEKQEGLIVDGMYGYIDNKIGYFPFLTQDDIQDMNDQEYPLQAPPCGGFMWDNIKNTLIDQDDYNDKQEAEQMLQDLMDVPLGEREQKILDDHYDLLGRLAMTGDNVVDDFVAEDRTCPECGGNCDSQGEIYGDV